MPTVHLRINDAATNTPLPVRLRITDAYGNYHPPLGRLSEFATAENNDIGGNVLHLNRQYCHIDGACEVDLPAGYITVEATHGFEYRPLRHEIDVKPGQLSIRLMMERWANLCAEGWYPGDTRAHFLSPHAALLEAAAEDLAIVHVLACDWRDPATGLHALPNLLAFSGQNTALTVPGHAVAVNTLNSSPLGQLALLHGHRIVYPLHVETINWTLADWCQQCHRKGGLVIWPDAIRSPQNGTPPASEALACLLLGQIDALETTELSWCHEDSSDYYDLLNCGLRVPLTGASAKKANTTFLGNVRTYAYVPPEEPWSQRAWIEAVRTGQSFATSGPLLTFTINGHGPGAVINSALDNRLHIHARARSLSRIDALQILHNGQVVHEGSGTATLDAEFALSDNGWWAARCRGHDPATFAHSSPIYVRTGHLPVHTVAGAFENVQRRLQHLEAQVNALAAAGRFASDKDERRTRDVVEAAKSRFTSLCQQTTKS